MIYLGADHGGFDLKEKMKAWLSAHGYAFEDLGNTIYDKDDDYPTYAFAVAERVAKEESERGNQGDQGNVGWKERAKGILACRSAAGVVIAANKVPGVRAVAVTNAEMAKHAREHNDANIIALSGDWIDDHQIGEILEAFLTTEFTNEERHTRRLVQIAAYEQRMMEEKR